MCTCTNEYSSRKKKLEIHRTQFHYGTRDYMYHSVAIENIVMDVKKPIPIMQVSECVHIGCYNPKNPQGHIMLTGGQFSW